VPTLPPPTGLTKISPAGHESLTPLRQYVGVVAHAREYHLPARTMRPLSNDPPVRVAAQQPFSMVVIDDNSNRRRIRNAAGKPGSASGRSLSAPRSPLLVSLSGRLILRALAIVREESRRTRIGLGISLMPHLDTEHDFVKDFMHHALVVGLELWVGRQRGGRSASRTMRLAGSPIPLSSRCFCFYCYHSPGVPPCFNGGFIG